MVRTAATNKTACGKGSVSGSVVKGSEDIQVQVNQICKALKNTKAGYPDRDLIVFPEYSTQGLNTAIWTYDEMLLTIDSPEVGRFKEACKENKVWGVFFIMEKNEDPRKPPSLVAGENRAASVSPHRSLYPQL